MVFYVSVNSIQLLYNQGLHYQKNTFIPANVFYGLPGQWDILSSWSQTINAMQLAADNSHGVDNCGRQERYLKTATHL